MQNTETLDGIIARYKNAQDNLIPILQEIQESFGYLSQENLRYLSESTKIPLANIYGVSTFYSQFKLKKTGENKIGVCMGTACYVKGADKAIVKIREHLDLGKEATTKDGKFTLELTRCVGACGLAPVVSVNENIYGSVSSEDIQDILGKY